MGYKKRRNKFGVVLPPDTDPRWVRTPYRITPEFAAQALPIGTVLHPSGFATMNDYNLWSQINAEREANFAVQREARRQQEIENERIRKQEEKARIVEEKRIRREREEIQRQIDRLTKDYERDIRQVSRSIDAQYNPQIASLQKQLKKLK
tara:strand:- start:255 stop:704 length:450 start_codon:yes stop_codon:yes gene_type:complete